MIVPFFLFSFTTADVYKIFKRYKKNNSFLNSLTVFLNILIYKEFFFFHNTNIALTSLSFQFKQYYRSTKIIVFRIFFPPYKNSINLHKVF